MNEPIQPITAFISCSLHPNDRPFVDLIERILKSFYIEPTGTVGRHTVAATNPAISMRQNIPLANMVVIVATPRHLQQDLFNGASSHTISEMLHVEAGMAYMEGKPVVVFVQKGTNPGNFITNITQYITIDGSQADLEANWPRISSLLNDAHMRVQQKKKSDANAALGDLAKGALMATGAVALLNILFSNDRDDDEHEVEIR